MRPPLIVGILLLVLGAFLLIRGGTFTSRSDVLKVGDIKITADEKKSIPTWVGAVAIIGGIALVAAGARKRG